ATPYEGYMRAWEKIRSIMNRLGYDGFVYENLAEGFKREALNQDPEKRNYYPYASQYPESSYVALDPTQLKSANNSGDFSGRDRKILNMRARNTQVANHGTPHTFRNISRFNPFGKFDLSFMGEGEGVQAFGFGFYFSGDWDVSESGYRKALIAEEYASPSSEEKLVRNIWLRMDPSGRSVSEETYYAHIDTLRDFLETEQEELKKIQEHKNDPAKKAAFVEEVLKQMRDNGTVPDGTSAADYYSRMWENNLKLSEDRLISSLRDLTDAIAIMENSSLDQFREMYNKSWESST